MSKGAIFFEHYCSSAWISRAVASSLTTARSSAGRLLFAVWSYSVFACAGNSLRRHTTNVNGTCGNARILGNPKPNSVLAHRYEETRVKQERISEKLQKPNQTSSYNGQHQIYQTALPTIFPLRNMQPQIIHGESLRESNTPENCTIAENWSSPKLSIARATVKPKITTVPHHLDGVDEIYVIVKGKGVAKIGNLEPAIVRAGDTVFIPAGTRQQIKNVGKTDLIFYCVCTPRFTHDCYRT
jgi:mannose-6-phosphate isomerase-like protein (cupin superfamily)